jgi:hypothetical protein
MGNYELLNVLTNLKSILYDKMDNTEGAGLNEIEEKQLDLVDKMILQELQKIDSLNKN